MGHAFQVFVYFWPIILFLSSPLTGPWILPKMHVQLFPKIDFTVEAYGCISTLITEWSSLPFWLPRNLSVHVLTGKSSLTSGASTLSLCFSRAQLLPLALSLESLGKNKASILLQQFGKLSSGHRTGKGQFSFQSLRKAMPKNAQTTAQLYSPHTLVK